jgi:hypothetical protein
MHPEDSTSAREALGSAPEWPPHLAAAIAALDDPRTSYLGFGRLPLRCAPLYPPPADLESLYLQLAFPVGIPLALWLVQDPEHPALRFAFMGRPVDPTEEPPGPLFACVPVSTDRPPIRLEVWRAHGYCSGQHAYGVKTWHPRLGSNAGVLGFGPEAPRGLERNRAFQALEQLLSITTDTRDQARALLVHYTLDAVRQPGVSATTVTRLQVARAMMKSPDTVDRLRQGADYSSWFAYRRAFVRYQQRQMDGNS